MINAREEAGSIVMGRNRMYIMGGLIDKELSRNTEVLNGINGAWEDGFSLPEGTLKWLNISQKIRWKFTYNVYV